jgi:glycosyltransferase involved in cell wall biosynthesis
MPSAPVSVIIPAYRAADTIGRAVESVINQSYPPCEIIVVDDGSPDNLALPLKVFGPRVRLIKKPNGGVASARNLGIEQAHGSAIAFLDADDYWEPDKLERQCGILADRPEVGLVASRCFVQRPGAPRAPRPLTTQFGSDPVSLFGRVLSVQGAAVLTVAMQIWTSTVVVRREVIGARRFEQRFCPAEDRDMWIRLTMSTGVYLDPTPLATAVEGPGSLSRSNADKGYEPLVRVVRQHGELLDRRALRAVEAKVFRSWAAAHLTADKAANAIHPAWQRLRRQPFSSEAWWVLGKSLLLSITVGEATARA